MTLYVLPYRLMESRWQDPEPTHFPNQLRRGAQLHHRANTLSNS